MLADCVHAPSRNLGGGKGVGKREDKAWKEQRMQDQKGGGGRLRDHPLVSEGKVIGSSRLRFVMGDSNYLEVLGLHGIKMSKF